MKTIKEQRDIITGLLEAIFEDTIPQVLEGYRTGIIDRSNLDLRKLKINKLVEISDRVSFFSVQGMTIAKIISGDEEETGIPKESAICVFLRQIIREIDELKNNFLFIDRENKTEVVLKIGTLAKNKGFDMDFVFKNVHRPTIEQFVEKCKNQNFPAVYSKESNIGEYYLALYYLNHIKTLKELDVNEATRIFEDGDVEYLMAKNNDCEDKTELKKLN